MKTTLWVAVLILLMPAVSFARSWTGYLVDAKCYASEEENTRSAGESTGVDRDHDLEVRMCTPNKKSKTFAIVLWDWSVVWLDEGSNAKAAELVRSQQKRSLLRVMATGEVVGKGDIVAVESLSPHP